MVCCQLFSTHYTAVQVKNWLKTTSVINVASMKITGDATLLNYIYCCLKVKHPLSTTVYSTCYTVKEVHLLSK